MNSKELLMKRVLALDPKKQALLANKLPKKASGKLLIEPVEENLDVKASFAQESIWLAEQISGTSTKYNMASVYAISGRTNVDAIVVAFTYIYNRHESLRTIFQEISGEVYQVIGCSELLIPVHDFRDKTISESAIDKLVKDFSHWQFDLTAGPLIKVEIFRITNEDTRLLINVHHAIFDGCSKGIILKELEVLYAYMCSQQVCSLTNFDSRLLKNLPIQYRDYAQWQRTNTNLEEQLDFWERQLSGVPDLLTLPTDQPRSSVQSDNGSTERIEISQETTEALANIGRGASASPFMTMLTLFSLLLSRYSGQENVVIGTPIDSRHLKNCGLWSDIS